MGPFTPSNFPRSQCCAAGLSLWPCHTHQLVQITVALSPVTLEIHNDSHRHAHHKAMQNSASKETHFRSVIFQISSFESHACLSAAGLRSQTGHHVRSLPLQDATGSPQNGLHPVERRDVSGEWHSRPAATDHDAGGGEPATGATGGSAGADSSACLTFSAMSQANTLQRMGPKGAEEEMCARPARPPC